MAAETEPSARKKFTQIIRIYSVIGAWRRTNFLFWMCVVLTASMHVPESAECRHENQLKRLGLTNLTSKR